MHLKYFDQILVQFFDQMQECVESHAIFKKILWVTMSVNNKVDPKQSKLIIKPLREECSNASKGMGFPILRLNV